MLPSALHGRIAWTGRTSQRLVPLSHVPGGYATPVARLGSVPVSGRTRSRTGRPLARRCSLSPRCRVSRRRHRRWSAPGGLLDCAGSRCTAWLGGCTARPPRPAHLRRDPGMPAAFQEDPVAVGPQQPPHLGQVDAVQHVVGRDRSNSRTDPSSPHRATRLNLAAAAAPPAQPAGPAGTSRITVSSGGHHAADADRQTAPASS